MVDRQVTLIMENKGASLSMDKDSTEHQFANGPRPKL